jgi:hypothetical protein
VVFGNLNAHRRAVHLAVFDEVVGNVGDGFHRNGEAEALEGEGAVRAAGVFQGIDALEYQNCDISNC